MDRNQLKNHHHRAGEIAAFETLKRENFIVGLLIDWIMPDSYKGISTFIIHAFGEYSDKRSKYILNLYLAEVVAAGFSIRPRSHGSLNLTETSVA